MTAAHAPAPRSRGTVGWGILATGGIAQKFARDLALHGHRIVAVGSRSLHNAQRFADEFDIPSVHGSYEALVADPEVDVVYVATPHTFHADGATSALDHDKHVLVEKSFTLDAHQDRAGFDRARGRQRLVMEAMWTRFLTHMAFVREAVTSGRIGPIRSVHADHTQQLPSDPAHRLNDLKLGGGALLDPGVHPLSFAHDLLGPPTEITARGVLGPTGADTSVATILGTRAAPCRPRTRRWRRTARTPRRCSGPTAASRSPRSGMPRRWSPSTTLTATSSSGSTSR